MRTIADLGLDFVRNAIRIYCRKISRTIKSSMRMKIKINNGGIQIRSADCRTQTQISVINRSQDSIISQEIRISVRIMTMIFFTTLIILVRQGRSKESKKMSIVSKTISESLETLKFKMIIHSSSKKCKTTSNWMKIRTMMETNLRIPLQIKIMTTTIFQTSKDGESLLARCKRGKKIFSSLRNSHFLSKKART